MKKRLIISLLVVFIVCTSIILARVAPKNEIVSFISSVYSPRQFRDTPVGDDLIEQILIAGHKAPSARNLQPWHFTVVKNKATMKKIMGNIEINDGNVLIVVSGPADPARFSIDFDTALATQNMFLAAQALGLAARMYAIPIPSINENHRGTLQIPEAYRAYIVLRIGYEADGVDAVSAASPRQPLDTKVNWIE
jgi:nitroreductase